MVFFRGFCFCCSLGCSKVVFLLFPGQDDSQDERFYVAKEKKH